jgi:hypothetical protein
MRHRSPPVASARDAENLRYGFISHPQPNHPLRASDIANRITGFSTPVFGVQWNPPRLDREVARRVIVFLEDRRVLYEPMQAEMPEYCVESVLEIRAFLTEVLGDGGVATELSGNLRAMRAACRKFMSALQELGSGGALYLPSSAETFQGFGRSWTFNQALGELRGVFGLHIGKLAVNYGVDVPEPLSDILPLDPTDDDGDVPLVLPASR